MPTCDTITVEEVANESTLTVNNVDATNITVGDSTSVDVAVFNNIVSGDGETLTRDVRVTSPTHEVTASVTVQPGGTQNLSVTVPVDQSGQQDICAEIL